MSLPRLPLTVLGGYLGAGKTTLLNRLLSEDHGQRIMVMVNDFGAINIDASLIAAASSDTLTLSNGCVCCTMGADLFMAMGDALDRRPRPDHLVIEASGVADPAKIADAARTEPEMSYGGIAVVVDALNWPALADDPLIGAQLQDQVRVADMLLVSKTDGTIADGLAQRLTALTPAPQIDLSMAPEVAPLLLSGILPRPASPKTAPHPAYVGWSHDSDQRFSRASLFEKLTQAPANLYRIKGRVLGLDAPGWEIHRVGTQVDIKRCETPRTQLVALGPAEGLTRQDIENWWAA